MMRKDEFVQNHINLKEAGMVECDGCGKLFDSDQVNRCSCGDTLCDSCMNAHKKKGH